MKWRLINGFLVLAVVILSGACSNVPSVKEAPYVNEVHKNSQFNVILPEDHRDGSTWSLSSDYDAKVLIKMHEVWHGNKKGIYFTLKALNKGQTTIKFNKRYYRDTLETRQFVISVIEP